MSSKGRERSFAPAQKRDVQRVPTPDLKYGRSRRLPHFPEGQRAGTV
jgi:hypothetical protein